MTYGEARELINTLHSGATVPNNLAMIFKLVLGKIARKKIKSRVKIGEITVGENTEFVLGSDSCLPAFLALKPDAENGNKCIYYYQSTEPYFLKLTTPSRFAEHTEGGHAMLEGRTLNINFPEGTGTVSTIYVPYYSKYLVLDEDGSNEKETPENTDDEFLIGSEFDDVLIDLVLLYLKREDMDDAEFMKANGLASKALNEVAFYS